MSASILSQHQARIMKTTPSKPSKAAAIKTLEYDADLETCNEECLIANCYNTKANYEKTPSKPPKAAAIKALGYDADFKAYNEECLLVSYSYTQANCEIKS